MSSQAIQLMITSHSTPLGLIILIANNGRLIYANWDSPECNKKKNKILSESHLKETDEDDHSALSEAIRQIDEYFAGIRREFDISVQLIGTPFQKTVWSQLQLIPYGSTLSYSEVAKKCGGASAARAVANACGANPLAIFVPCHRVVAAKGRLGGYTGGIAKKIGLLNIEKTENV